MSTDRPASATYDAVLIGSGHNALVCAACLARAGWGTLVLEQADSAGGSLRSAQATLPGFVHDLFATNLNLFAGSAAAAELGEELVGQGFEYVRCARPFANVFPDGRALRVHQGAEATLAELERHDHRDAAGWRELDRVYERLSPVLFSLYGSRLDARSLIALAASHLPALRGDGVRELVRLLVSSTRELCEQYLQTPQARALLACWGMHLDFAPDVCGGAMFPLLEAFTDMRAGMVLARGGASRLTDALCALAREHGGELRTGAQVVAINVADGRASGVELASGERIAARRAVIAGVAPRALYERLLGAVGLPSRLRAAARAYRFGPATMMLHLALSAPPRWAAGEDLGGFAYVHIAPYLDDLAQTYAHAQAGLLPAEPLLVVGQSSAVDPSRVRAPAPAGAQTLWVQVRALPASIRGDALGQIRQCDWQQAAQPYAERVLAKLEHYAPGLGASVLACTVLSPAELERANPNLVGGDSLAGSMHLSQNFLMRPFWQGRDYETGVPGLLMVGASTWPGAGLNAVSGYNVARKLLEPPRARDDLRLALRLAGAGGRWLGRPLAGSAAGRERRARPSGRRRGR
jgi:phytoene dehydrogenase-like protein